MKKVPLRFWAALAGLIGIVVCFLQDWASVIESRQNVVPGLKRGEGFSLFAMLDQPESGALRVVLLVLAVLMLSAVAAIAAMAVLMAARRFRSSGLQAALAFWGFGFAALIPLVFVILAASIKDPALLKLTLFPVVQTVIALAALVLVQDKLIGAARRDWQLYVLLLPAVALVFIFSYLPLYGIQIAFRDFKAAFGIPGSKWIGWKNFTDFFAQHYAPRLILNTLLLNVYGLLVSFPAPILMAIFLNQFRHQRFKRFTQTAIYAPHFISPVVLVGMLFLFFSPNGGMVNRLIEAAGGTSINFMLEASWFRTLFIGTDVWQHAGWNTILYIAALTAIDPGLYEAATIDGATKTQKIRYIDIPHLVPIVVMLLILNCGAMMASNTDKALLMQTSGNIPTSDIIGVYVYNIGLKGGEFSYTAAINLFVNVINFAMIISVNWISKRLNQTGLF